MSELLNGFVTNEANTEKNGKEMASSTIFKNFTIPVEKKPLWLIVLDIISDKYKTEVEEIRTLIVSFP